MNPQFDELENNLSRRERQVLDIVISLEKATARDVEQNLEDTPSYSAVRSILRILVEKKLLIKRGIEGRDWFLPSISPEAAKKGALRSLVNRFFQNSVTDAACALLGDGKLKLSEDEAARLTKLIKEASKK